MRITRITAPEFDELIAFLDAAFSHSGQLTFRSLLPGLYQPTDEHCRNNYAIRIDGQLAAVVGAFPIDWRTPAGVLKIVGIGGVCVGADYRRTGLMRELMDHVLAESRALGYHMSFLTGRRQRYRYFGYELAGLVNEFTVEPGNLRHCFGDEAAGVTLRPCRLDAAELAVLGPLHDSLSYHCNRSSMARHLRHWHHVPMTAEDEAGRIVGYAVFGADMRMLHELAATDDATAVRIVRAAVTRHDAAIRVSVPGLSDAVTHELARIAERTAIVPCGNWLVFDWPATLRTLLGVRPLADGQVVLRVADAPQSLRLIVSQGQATCEWCDAQPDVTADGPTMMRLLFGPTRPRDVMPLPPRSILDAWCPLPLHLPKQDHI